MIEMIQSIILGLIQGLTEFLPISSSAHLNLFPWIFHWDEISESFDVALHLGTLLAICVFFFKEWIELIRGGFLVAKEKLVRSKAMSQLDKSTSFNGKMFWYLVIATIPAGILSIVLSKLSDYLVGDNLDLEMGLIAIALIVMGILLYVMDKKSKSEVTYENITLKQSLLVGTSQAIAAAFPGVSRSGITMTVARALRIDRESAAKFSFLLATPIVAAAVLFDITKFTFSVPFFITSPAEFTPEGIFFFLILWQHLQHMEFPGPGVQSQL